MALCSSFARVLSTQSRRNFGSTYIVLAKASDPIQQLFLDKISDFKKNINNPKFFESNPGIEKALKDELNRVTRQYGGEKPEDLAQFPQIKLEDPTPDSQPGF